MNRNGLTDRQIDVLLSPIRPHRVLSLSSPGRPPLSYLAQHDVRAHLNRVFGFTNWSVDVLDTSFVYDAEAQGKDGKPRWTACYTATVKLTVCDMGGVELAHYTDCHASGCAPQPDRAEAHALAVTSAVSTALKRAAANLGDQFGLSLYNKGQTSAFVGQTLQIHQAIATQPEVHEEEQP